MQSPIKEASRLPCDYNKEKRGAAGAAVLQVLFLWTAQENLSRPMGFILLE